MLRRFIFGMLLASGLAIGAVGTAGSAGAQDGGFCSKFDSGSDGFGPCSDAPNVAVTTATDSGGITPTDPYLKVTDLSGPSRVCSSDPKYLGDWLKKMNGCGQFCFDFKVFSSGYPPSAITPSFTIVGGGGKATFVANFQVAIGDTSWHRNICAPIADGASPPTSSSGHWVISGSATWNQIITGVTMVQLPIDFTSQPSEVVGYDNICVTSGGCGVTPPPEIKGCLEDSKVDVKCNPDGTYTLTLSGSSFSGTDITLSSQTAGVTVSPPQQPWAATTTWTISGATPGQTVTLSANASNAGGGSVPGADQCCSGEIKIVMPDCPIDVRVDKENTPTGGPGNGFNVWVTNVGAPITFAPGELTVDEYVPAGLTISVQLSTNWTCLPLPATGAATIHCTYNLAGSLGTGAQLTDSLLFRGTLTDHEKTLENCAVVSIPASVGVDGNPSNDKSCVPLTDVKVGELIFTKHVVYVGPIPMPSQPYPVTVTCGGTTTTLNLLDNVPQAIGNLTYGTVCSYTEPTPPVPPNVCPPNKTGVWTTVFAPPPSLTINAPVTNVSVTNTLTCQDKELLVDLGINKTGGTTPVQQPYYVFDVTVTNVGVAINTPGAIVVTDTVPADMTFNTMGGGGWTCVPPGGPAGTLITCTYSGTATAGQVLPVIHVDATSTAGAPYPPVTNCAQVGLTTASGLTDTNSANDNSCVTVTKPVVCTPPMILNAAGTCTCPPGMHPTLDGKSCEGPPPPPPGCRPPMVAGPVPGQCLCPTGTVQRGQECIQTPTCTPPMISGAVPGQCVCPGGTVRKGQDCVRTITCRAPQIPNAAGTDCVCPGGTVKRGRSCAKPVVCQPPAKPNRRGECQCPQGMVTRGHSCVERERRAPNFIPGGIGRRDGGGSRGTPDRRGGGGGGGGAGAGSGRHTR